MRIAVNQPFALTLEHAEPASPLAAGGRLAELETAPQRPRVATWSRVVAGVGFGLSVVMELVRYLVALMPLVLFSILCLTNGELMSQPFTDPVGRMLVAIGVTLQLLGFLWIRKTVSSET